DAGLTEKIGDLVSARLGRAFEFAKNDFTMINMADDAGFDAIQANEAKPAQDGVRRNELGKGLFVSESILQGEDGSGRGDQRWNQQSKLIVGRGLKSNEHKIAYTDFFWSTRAFGMHEKISLRAVDKNPIAADSVIIRAQKKVRLMSGMRELTAVETAHGAAT